MEGSYIKEKRGKVWVWLNWQKNTHWFYPSSNKYLGQPEFCCVFQGEKKKKRSAQSFCFNPSWMPSVSRTASPLLRITDRNSLGKIHTTSSCFLTAQSSSSWLKCSLAGGIHQPPNLFLSQSSTAPSIITTWGYHFLSHKFPEQRFSGQNTVSLKSNHFLQNANLYTCYMIEDIQN